MMYINITYNGEGVDTFFTQSGKRRVDPEVPNCQYCETAMAFLHCSKSPMAKQYQQLVAELAPATPAAIVTAGDEHCRKAPLLGALAREVPRDMLWGQAHRAVVEALCLVETAAHE